MKLWLQLSLLCTITLARSADLPAVSHKFVVIAHRGDHEQAVENTLTAIDHAIAAGADYVELDVRRTTDGHHVLMHDSTVDRTTDGHGAIREMSLGQIRALHVRDLNRPQIAADRVPTFEEALARIKGRINLYLDFKQGDRQAVVDAIRKAEVTMQVLVYDSASPAQEWHRLAPELPLICSPPGGQEPSLVKGLSDFCRTNGISVLDSDWSGYTRTEVTELRKQGLIVWPDIQNKVEGEDYFEKVRAIGFDGVQTDHPEELIAWLKRLQIR